MKVAHLEPPEITTEVAASHTIFAGVDTHKDTHHVAIVDDLGRPIADREFLAVGSGYRQIIDFLHAHGIVGAVGVEGTGSYGAELARVLAGAGMRVLEVTRANRAERRLRGKSDPPDAKRHCPSSPGEDLRPRNNATAMSSRCGSCLQNAPPRPRPALPA